MPSFEIDCRNSDLVMPNAPTARLSSRRRPPKRIRLDHDQQPDWHVASFHHLPLNEFAKRGIEHVLIDVDGCLTPAYRHDDIDPVAHRKIAAMVGRFTTVSLASNNKRDLGGIARQLELDFAFTVFSEDGVLPYKPHSEFFDRILRDLGEPDPETVVMIGDNPWHDVAGAQAMGMRAALVDCLDPEGFFEFDLYIPRAGSQ